MNKLAQRSFICFSILLLFTFPKTSHALPLQIDIIDASFTTFVQTRLPIVEDERLTDGYVVTSRTKNSTLPTSDYLYDESDYFLLPDIDDIYRREYAVASASANLFEISAYTDSGVTQWENSLSFAKTEIIFSPLVDALQPIKIDFMGYYEWFFSDGFVSLIDLTSNQELWDYSWYGHNLNNVIC